MAGSTPERIIRALDSAGIRYVLVDGVAALDDVIASKQASDRPKDRLQLGILGELADERERNRRPDGEP